MNLTKKTLAPLARLGIATLVAATLTASAAGTASAAVVDEPGVQPTADAGLVEHVGGWEVANSEVHTQGRLVSTLFPHQGRIFAGHGNYNANSGSGPVNDGTAIGSYDPVTDTHVVESAGWTTEEVMAFREIDGALYAPNVDPTTAHADQPYLTNASGTWGYAGEPVRDAIHVFDIAKLGDEWFLFGAGWTETRGQAGTVQAAATIWRSADGLTDWTVAYRAPETAADYDGYERFYWGATHGDTLYAAATQGTKGTTPPIVQYKDGVWSDVPAPSPAGSWLEYVGAQNVHSTEHGVLFANSGQLHLFDGTSFTNVDVLDGQFIVSASLADDGYLYLLTSDRALTRVDPVTLAQEKFWRGTDSVLANVTAMTVQGGVAYFAAVADDGITNRMLTLTLPETVPTVPGDGEPGDGGTTPAPGKGGNKGGDKGKGKPAHADTKGKPAHAATPAKGAGKSGR